MVPVERELAALKFIDDLSVHLRDVREPHKALRHALREERTSAVRRVSRTRNRRPPASLISRDSIPMACMCALCLDVNFLGRVAAPLEN